MKKKTLIIVISIFASIAIVIGALVYFDYIPPKADTTTLKTSSKLVDTKTFSSTLEMMQTDKDFYSNIYLFSALLEDADYKYFTDSFETLVENKDSQDLLMMVYLSKLYEDKKIESMVTNLNKLLKERRQSGLTQEEKNDTFDKNNKCAQLVSGIQDQLKSKFDNSASFDESETLEFVTYSPNLNNCLYATYYSYRYTNTYDYTNSYNYSARKIYNASTNAEINEYITYYYNYPNLTDDEEEVREKNNQREYIKYILENTNYNVELLEDLL